MGEIANTASAEQIAEIIELALKRGFSLTADGARLVSPKGRPLHFSLAEHTKEMAEGTVEALWEIPEVGTRPESYIL